MQLLLLLLLLSHFSRVWLCATPETAAHQAPPSLGFSRQEHWSGLPFPSPMHESEKWKWSLSVVSDPSWPHGLQPTRLLRPWDLPGKSTGVGNMQQGGSKKKKGKKESAAAQERERRERLDQLFQTWKMEVARECRQPLKIGKTRDNFSPRASRRNVVLPTPWY